MVTTESDVLRLVTLVHEAAAEPACWAAFVEQYTRAIDGDVAILQRHDFAQGRSTAFVSYGMTQQFTELYNAHYSRLNVWRDRGRHLYVSGRVFIDTECLPRALLKRTEFFNDYLLPNHGTHCLSVVVSRGPSHAITLAVLRDEPRTPWEPAQRRIAELVLPHVTQAFHTYQRLQAAAASEAALHALPVGILMLRGDGTIVFANRAADAIFRAADGLTTRDGTLVAADRAAAGALHAAISQAARPGESMACAQPLRVARLSMRPAYHLTVAPWRPSLRLVGVPAPAVIVFIADTDARLTTPIAALRLAYGLTKKEAAVTAELAAGRTVRQTADLLGMSYETARTHLRRIFSKTGVSRQSDLVSIVMRLSVPALQV